MKSTQLLTTVDEVRRSFPDKSGEELKTLSFKSTAVRVSSFACFVTSWERYHQMGNQR